MKRRVPFKKPFALLQKIACTALCVVTLLVWSCQNDAEPLSDDQISINLSKKGKNDPKLLIGVWEAVKFAYTADGKKISDVVNIESVILKVPCVPPSPDCMVDYTEQWWLFCANFGIWNCSLSGNSINLKYCVGTNAGSGCPHEEVDMYNALTNAYSFVIKGNELMIFFTGGEYHPFYVHAKHCSIAGEKKTNIIIFEKR